MLNKQSTWASQTLRQLGRHLPGLLRRSGSVIKVNRNLLKPAYEKGWIGKGMLTPQGTLRTPSHIPRSVFDKFKIRIANPFSKSPNKTLQQLSNVYKPHNASPTINIQPISEIPNSAIMLPNNMISTPTLATPRVTAWPILSHELGHWNILDKKRFGNYYKHLYEKRNKVSYPSATLVRGWNPQYLNNSVKTEFAASKQGLRLWPYKTTIAQRKEAVDELFRPALNSYKAGALSNTAALLDATPGIIQSINAFPRGSALRRHFEQVLPRLEANRRKVINAYMHHFGPYL